MGHLGFGNPRRRSGSNDIQPFLHNASLAATAATAHDDAASSAFHVPTLPLSQHALSAAASPRSVSSKGANLPELHAQARRAREWILKIYADFLAPSAVYEININSRLAK